jgi:taurine dioxygenase
MDLAQPSDWRCALHAEGLTTRDLSPHTGTEVAGLDLASPIAGTIIDTLAAACAERTVLLFRGQHTLTPDAYLAFARRFGGRPDLHSKREYCLPGHHEIFVVGNVVADGKPAGATRVGQNWHTDHYHLPEPGLFTFLHALAVPAASGETRYVNGMAAYDALPPAMQQRIAGRQVLHSRARLFRALFPEATDAECAAEQRKVPDVIHPLVRQHPATGRRGLFLGGEWGSSIIGEADAAPGDLFDTLLQHMISGDFTYEHAWQPGDVLMSDNRCSLHRASDWDETTQQRRLHRIILVDIVAPIPG